MISVNEKISIVIPIYNSEEFIKESLGSLLNQTYHNFEIICINDASTDQTLKYIKNMQKVDHRIIIIENVTRMGAAYCRNKGLEISSGKYVIFLDSDDYFENCLLEKTVSLAEDYSLDICLFDYKVVLDDGTLFNKSNLIEEKYSKTVFDYYEITHKDIIGMATAPWNKLYKKSFIEKERLFFQSIPSSNDVMFSVFSLLTAKRIKAVKEKPLVIAKGHKGKDRITNNRNAINEFLAVRRMFSESKVRNFNEKQKELIFVKSVSLLLQQFSLPEGTGVYYTFLQDEGIRILYEAGGDFFAVIARKYNYPLERFAKEKFETKWYLYMNLLLMTKENPIWIDWNNEKKVVVWGAGIYGKQLIWAAELQKKRINRVIDSDITKNGMDCFGYSIELVSNEALLGADILIIAIKNITEDMKYRIAKTNCEVRFLTDYI